MKCIAKIISVVILVLILIPLCFFIYSILLFKSDKTLMAELLEKTTLSVVYTEEELNKLLKIGMTSKEVMNIFGQPIPGNCGKTEVYTYMFNPSKVDSSGEFDEFGFTVELNEGKVSSWEMIKMKIHDDIYLSRTYTSKELDSLLKCGMTEEEVQKLFGVPSIAVPNSYTYNFKPCYIKKDPPNDFYTIGFHVSFDSGKISNWGLMHSNRPKEY